MTPEKVRNFWGFMMDRFGAEYTSKASSIQMRAISYFLHGFGILDAKNFMEQYATTIAHTVYLPFEVGDEYPPLWNQVCLCVHECTHVFQYNRMGAFDYTRTYLNTAAGRTKLEAEAYSTRIEMEFWRTGKLVDPKALARLLDAYAVSLLDAAVAEKTYKTISAMVSRGFTVNATSRAAINWLNDNASEVRGV
jgi:hypothetical protein